VPQGSRRIDQFSAVLHDSGWPDFGRTTALNAATRCASLRSISPGQRVYGLLADVAVDVYGSDGGSYLAVTGASSRSVTRPICHICAQDEIFDRTARHPAAAVRVGLCREPYVLNVCEYHLAPLRETLPAGGLWSSRDTREKRHEILMTSPDIQGPKRRAANLSEPEPPRGFRPLEGIRPCPEPTRRVYSGGRTVHTGSGRGSRTPVR
jgi:hypothetical protein